VVQEPRPSNQVASGKSCIRATYTHLLLLFVEGKMFVGSSLSMDKSILLVRIAVSTFIAGTFVASTNHIVQAHWTQAALAQFLFL
jgi:hypothetical protein